MTHLAVFLLCAIAFGALAMAMERHQQDLLGRTLSRGTTRGLRGLGWALLLIALWLVQDGMGWSLGLVAYSGHTSAAAGLVFVSLLAWDRRGTTGSRSRRPPGAAGARAPWKDAPRS